MHVFGEKINFDWFVDIGLMGKFFGSRIIAALTAVFYFELLLRVATIEEFVDLSDLLYLFILYSTHTWVVSDENFFHIYYETISISIGTPTYFIVFYFFFLRH